MLLYNVLSLYTAILAKDYFLLTSHIQFVSYFREMFFQPVVEYNIHVPHTTIHVTHHNSFYSLFIMFGNMLLYLFFYIIIFVY